MQAYRHALKILAGIMFAGFLCSAHLSAQTLPPQKNARHDQALIDEVQGRRPPGAPTTGHDLSDVDFRDYDDLSSVDQIVLEEKVMRILHDTLGPYLDEFMAAYEEFAKPVYIKPAGALLVSGFQSLTEDMSSVREAMFLIYPDGRLYALYVTPDLSKIRYFSNDALYAGSVHPILKILIRSLSVGRDFPIVMESADQGRRLAAPMPPAAAPQVPQAPQSFLGASEEEALRAVIRGIWPSDVSTQWNLNKALLGVLSSAVRNIMQCAKWMSLAENPSAFSRGPGWLVSYRQSIVERFRAVSSDMRYGVCITAAAGAWKRQMELASILGVMNS